MKNLKPIEKLLSNHTVSAEEFLSTPNISSAIRSQLSRFINYCKTHKPFTVRMLQLAFNVSYEELQDESMKKASFTANEVLGNEEPEIAQMFFQPPAKEEPQESEIKEELNEGDGGITSEAQRLFKFSDDEEQTVPAGERRQVQITREEMVSLSLEILKNKEKNDTCLGHLQKMYSFFIRHEPIPVLAYFNSHPETLNLFLKNIQYSSISTLLAQLLTSEDKNKQYKYQSLKKQILEKTLEEIFSNLKDQFFFDGALVFLDEILSATKQSYFEYFQDFKRISNIMTTSQLMERFYNQLIQVEEDKLFNVSRYLQNLFSRINSDNQDNRYYQREENQPTVHFQIDIFVQNISTLLGLSTKVMQFKSITKIHYFSFLEGLINSQQVKSSTVPINDESFKALLDAYKNHNSGGIVKNKLYQIIKTLLSRATEQKLKQLRDKEPQIYESYFSTLKQANYGNTKNYNKNEQAAFDVSLIAQLTRKQEQELITASKAMNKDMKRICKKYDTKIASFQNSASTFSLEEECNFYQYNGDFGKSSGESGTGFNLSIGRNNVSIPVLHLPDRYHNSQKQQRQPQPEIMGDPDSPSNSPTVIHSSPITADEPSKDAIIQEEQVVVLTDKLKDNMGINLTQIMSENRRQENTEKKPEVPVEVKTKAEDKPKKEEKSKPKEEGKDKDKLMDVPRLELTSKLLKEGKLGDDQGKTRFFTRHLALYA